MVVIVGRKKALENGIKIIREDFEKRRETKEEQAFYNGAIFYVQNMFYAKDIPEAGKIKPDVMELGKMHQKNETGKKYQSLKEKVEKEVIDVYTKHIPRAKELLSKINKK